jgi:hypothetical protein
MEDKASSKVPFLEEDEEESNSEPPFSASQALGHKPISSRSPEILPLNHRGPPPPDSCHATSIDSLKQDYDRDTWRMFNRISLARSLVPVSNDSSWHVKKKSSKEADAPYLAFTKCSLRDALIQKLRHDPPALNCESQLEATALVDTDMIFDLELDE